MKSKLQSSARNALLGVFLSALGLAPITAKGSETITVCYDHWPPMTIFPTAEEPRRGVVIDMVSDIYQAAGYRLSFVEAPYARGLEMVANGECDMLPEKEASPLTGGEGFVYGNQPTFRYPMAFVVRKGESWRFSGIESLRDRRVATGVGWDYSSINPAYQDFLTDPANRDNVELMAGDNDVVPRIFRMIAAGRVDVYADNVLVLAYLRTRHGMVDTIDVVQPGLGGTLMERPIFSLRLPPGQREALMRTWDEGRAALTEQQEQSYLSRYGIHGVNLAH